MRDHNMVMDHLDLILNMFQDILFQVNLFQESYGFTLNSA